MAILTRDEIIAAVDLTPVEVEVPEWGGSVLVKGLTAKQRGYFTNQLVDQRKTGNIVHLEQIQIRLCALSIVGPNGGRLFSDANMNDLAQKSAGALQRVFEVAQKLSGLSDEQVEELAGNSLETPDDDSPLFSAES